MKNMIAIFVAIICCNAWGQAPSDEAAAAAKKNIDCMTQLLTWAKPIKKPSRQCNAKLTVDTKTGAIEAIDLTNCGEQDRESLEAALLKQGPTPWNEATGCGTERRINLSFIP